jgi:hypothetical protein
MSDDTIINGATQNTPENTATAGSQSASTSDQTNSTTQKTETPDKSVDQQKTDPPKAEDKKPDEKPAEDPKAWDLKAPENSGLDEKHVKEVVDMAKSLNLNAEQAKGLLERDAKIVADQQKLQEQNIKEFRSSLYEQTQADKEIGGSNFDRSVADCKRVVDRFGSPEFRKALNESGLGNHPEVVRVFARIGRTMAEDGIGPKSQAKPEGPKTFAEAMYPGQ